MPPPIQSLVEKWQSVTKNESYTDALHDCADELSALLQAQRDALMNEDEDTDYLPLWKVLQQILGVPKEGE